MYKQNHQGNEKIMNAFRLLLFIPMWNFCPGMTNITFANHFTNLTKMPAQK